MLSTLCRAVVAVTVFLLALAVAPSAAATAAPQQVDPLYLQVVAHQDDDLFFLNPDVDDTIAAGLPSVTVYLTAGQLTGDGDTDGQRARNRQRGVQNAYATMAGVSDADDTTQQEWTGIPWRIAGRSVELYVLNAKPYVHLVFLNLHDGSLRNIDTGGTGDTVLPAGGLVTTVGRYNRSDVVQMLRAIMATYRPSVLRTHDAEPDRRDGYTADHTDHVATAVFTREAAAGQPRTLVEVNYRAYNIADVPANLSAAQVTRKSRILDEYYRYDQASRDSRAGDNWVNRMYRRWPQGTNWVIRDAGNLLHAFVVLNGRAYTYPQQAGGVWVGSRPLPDAGGHLAPGLSVVRTVDGRLQLFARRLSDHRIISLSQQEPGGAFGDWVDLGNPNTGLGKVDEVGTPAVATNADGRLQLFVKNGGGGLSSLRQTTIGGAWSRTWIDLGGTDLQDGLTAVTGPQGRIEVFASTRSSVLRWSQTRPNDAFERDFAFQSGVPASAPQATLDRQGRITVAYRRADTGTVAVMSQAAIGGAWQSPADLGGPGIGEPATTLSPTGPDARMIMVARDQQGGVSVSRQGGPNVGFGPWAPLGGNTVGSPAGALDTASRVVIFTVGGTGLSVVRQAAPGADQPFGAWQDLGL